MMDMGSKDRQSVSAVGRRSKRGERSEHRKDGYYRRMTASRLVEGATQLRLLVIGLPT